MTAKIALICVFAAIFTALLVIVRKSGKQAERLRAMREAAERQARERAKEDAVLNSIRSLDDDSVRARLRKVSEGHKRNSL